MQRLGGAAFHAANEEDQAALLNCRIHMEDIYQRQVSSIYIRDV